MSDRPLPFDTYDTASPAAATAVPPWPVLVVDDDADIHRVTRLVLGDLTYAGRPLALVTAHSAREAIELLASQHFALALVDVVMEHDTAGLDVIRHLREQLGETRTRVIVRTGQPGTAPLLQTVHDHDISGYEEKSMQTVERLRAAVITALRTYEQLCAAAMAGVDDARAERLESAAAHADAALATLSDEVFRQQRQIDTLTRQLDDLRSRLAVVAEAADVDISAEQPPPHY